MAHDLIFPDITFITMSNEPEKVRGLIRKLNNVKVNHVFVVDKREKFKFLENYQNYVVIETKSKHFAYLLNLGIFYAKTKWVMEVDSDEELDENLLLSLTNLDDECDYYTVKKKALFMGKSYNYLTRNFVVIIKKNLCYYNGAVNERTNTKKLKGCHLNGELTNNSYDDWNVYWRKFYKYAKLHKKIIS